MATLKYPEGDILLPCLPQYLRDRKRGEDEVADAIALLEGLSKEQLVAVTSRKPYVRVIAGAGAGKTETLTRRIAYLLLTGGAEPSSIVAFTFTEKAAQSMKSRIYRLMKELGYPTGRLGEMYIGTIHAFAKRILEDHPKYGNYTLLDEKKEVAFLSNHSWDMFQGAGRIRRMAEFLKTFKMVLDEMLEEKALNQGAPEFYRLKKKYEAKLEEHRLLTFGMSIKLAVEVLREKPMPGVEHLFVDEYQDINRAQDEIIRLIGRGASVFVVGDPRQSIYQWRGSDERFFEAFPKEFAPVDEITIRENRRSASPIVVAANHFAEGFEVKHPEMSGERKDEGIAGLREFINVEEEARWVADQVEALVAGGLKHSDIGVLMRSVKNHAGPLIGELKRRRVPFVLGGGIGLFRRDEVQAMARLYSWLAVDGEWPEQPNMRGRALVGEELLKGGLGLWRAASGKLPSGAEAELRGIRVALYAGAGSDVKRRFSNHTQLYHALLNALGFKLLDYRDPNDAAVMANLGRYHVLLTDYESESRRNGGRPSWKASLRGLNWFMRTFAASAYEEQPVDDVRGVDAVKVMTVHQVKGLEWPVVFIMGASRDRFPLPVERWAGRRRGRWSSVGGADGDGWMGVPRGLFDAERYEGSTDEERRLFYVAMTRARDVLVITGAVGAGTDAGARGRSEFVEALLPDLENIETVQGAIERKKVAVKSLQTTEEMQSFAAGEIIRYGICPHMYLLGKVWGFQPELDVAIGFGNGLHYCLKRAAEAVKAGKGPVEAVREAVDRCFHVPFADEETEETFRNSARGILERFAADHGKDLRVIEESEYRIEYPVENATVTGRVDVIMREGGVREVREYKTSDEVVTPEELAVQIRMYALGLEGVGKPVRRASAAYLKEGRVDAVGIAGEELEDAKGLVSRCVRGIVGRKFGLVDASKSSSINGRCQRCDQNMICRWVQD